MKSRSVLIVLLLVATVGGTAWWLHDRNSPKLGREAYEATAAILAKGPRPPGSAALDEVRGYVQAELEKAGWVCEIQSFTIQNPNVTFKNLRARFRNGTVDPWQRKVDGLLCAHIDSKLYKDRYFLGADDAASACAAIVVIGKFLAEERPEQAAKLELVFFDGEEAFGENITPQDGLYGSRHYAGLWRSRSDKPTFGILLDMIGHENLTIRLPADTPPKLEDAVLAAAEAEGASKHFGMAAGPIIDDHVPLNFAGIPTVDIIGDFTRSGWWHKPSDNLKIISADSLDISIRVTLRVLSMHLGD